MQPETVEKQVQETQSSFRQRVSIASSACGLIGLIATSFLGTMWQPGLLRNAPLCLPLGTTQVNGGLALSYIISTNVYLGFDTTPVSSGVVPDTLILRGEGTKTLITGCTGKWFIIPFRGVI